MFKILGASEVSLTLASHVFTFRRLSWEDEVNLSKLVPAPRREDYAAFSMSKVDDKTVTFEVARKFLSGLPRPIRDRVVIFYLGSLPSRRAMITTFPYSAPEPVRYTQRVESEIEDGQEEGDRILDRTFGPDEVAEAEALATEMALAANFAGATPSATSPAQIPTQVRPPPQAPAPQPPGPPAVVGEGPVTYHMVVS